MSKYIISKIDFTSSSLTTETKLVKIKGAFHCDDEKALEILNVINENKSIEVDEYNWSDLVGYGVRCHVTTHEEIKEKEERDKLKRQQEEELEIKKQKAIDWFEGLNDEQKEFVKLLGYYKFSLVAVG